MALWLHLCLVFLAPHTGTTFLSLPSSFGGSGFFSQISEAWPALGQSLQPQS